MIGQRQKIASCSAVAIAALVCGFAFRTAHAADDGAVAAFYKENRVRIVVGYGPGGGYDTWARLVARHMGKYIPGHPSIIVENRPGAGALIAANAVYTSEPQDGTVIGTFSGGLVLHQALGEKRIKFDGRKFQWLGSGESSYSACVVRTDSGVHGMDDLLKGKSITMASQAPGNMTYDLPTIMNAAIGTKFKVISGYTSVPEMFLAVRNNEAQGICIGYVSVILAKARNMLEGHPPMVKPIVVTGDKPIKEVYLDGAPGAESLAKNTEGRTLLKVIRTPQQITFPYAMGPGVSKDRVKALQDAFWKTVNDPAFLAEAEKAGQHVAPSNAQEVTELVNDLLSVPQATIAKLNGILKKAR